MKKKIFSIAFCFTFLIGGINLLNAQNNEITPGDDGWSFGDWNHVVINGKRVAFFDCTIGGFIICQS